MADYDYFSLTHVLSRRSLQVDNLAKRVSEYLRLSMLLSTAMPCMMLDMEWLNLPRGQFPPLLTSMHDMCYDSVTHRSLFI